MGIAAPGAQPRFPGCRFGAFVASSDVMGSTRGPGIGLITGRKRLMNDYEVYKCPRCLSPRTSGCDDLGLRGYRKCIICGNCWRAREGEGVERSKEEDRTKSDSVDKPNAR